MSKHSETPPPPGGQFLVYQTQDGNPPFNDSDWFRKDDDVRWQFGVPPKGNANFACCSIRHSKFGLRHSPRLAPHGMAVPPCGIANGLAVAGSSNQSGEGEIRRALIEADLVDCMVALTDQLFYRTQIPVCLWFLAKSNNTDAGLKGPGYAL